MLTQRDIRVAAIAAGATLGVIGLTAFAATPQLPVLGPATFDWNAMTDVPNATGSVRSLYRGPTATLDELEMHITTLIPGDSSHPPHTHLNEELVIIREGTVETLSGGKWVKLGPGSVIFNASNSPHALRNIGTTPAVYHVINWSPNKATIDAAANP